jgi:hypothetical protein
MTKVILATEISTTLYQMAARLPPFCPDKPALWFAQEEAHLELTGVTSQKTSFNQVVTQLNQNAAEVEEILR